MTMVSTPALPEAAGRYINSTGWAVGCPAPLFVLAPPRSFTSVIGTMIGQHPQMYGASEAHLTAVETVADWWRRATGPTRAHRPDGLVRIVAELFFGGQREKMARRALGWLRRRCHLRTAEVFEKIIQRVAPLIFVDKSPSATWAVEGMKRAFAIFPQARFIHLLRHPRGQCESVLKFIEERKVRGRPVGPSHWLLALGRYPTPRGEEAEPALPADRLDPQWGWYTLNKNIVDFLAGVPAEQVYRLRGEEVLSDPDTALKPLCRWLGLRDDDEAIDEMKHPERSPFACYGPPSARSGMDAFFLESPALRPTRASTKSVEGPLAWRGDGRGFAPAVRRLAEELGYK
jgi:hypothetical protein